MNKLFLLILCVYILFICIPVFGNEASFYNCNGFGIFNTATESCVCVSGRTGLDCSKRVCPWGTAWADYPTAVDTAHAAAECSNVGFCDSSTGKCKCRMGFEGRACERLSCPRDNKGQVCSGRGQCITMRQAASSFNGYMQGRLVSYTSNWDADVIQGCSCDWGFHGYDCSLRSCPTGDNPLTYGGKNEIMKLTCNATAGSFYIQFRGDSTTAIPYNAGEGFLKNALESLAGVNQVTVTTVGGTSICAPTGSTTTIQFMQDFGNLPPARVVYLDLVGTVYFITEQDIVCAACPTCSGGIFLTYDNATTTLIPYNANPATFLSALQSLTSLSSASALGAIYLSVTMTPDGTSAATMCQSGASVQTTVLMESRFGNLFDFTLINSVKSGSTLNSVTLTTPSGTKENDWCSGCGWCDTKTGHCDCYINVTDGYVKKTEKTAYVNGYKVWFHSNTTSLNYTYANHSAVYGTYWDNRFETSDGYGNAGTRGDCGHAAVNPIGCPGSINDSTLLWVKCSGNGICSSTFQCVCNSGWLGPACNKKACPVGKAWWDQAYGSNKAHAFAECSNMGICNYDTGICDCREGFTGAACNRFGCVNDCSGFGVCEPMWRLAQLAIGVDGSPLSITYGQTSANAAATWDWDMIFLCVCDTRSIMSPYNGPRAYIQGLYIDKPFLGGRTGYDCSERFCPYGDDPLNPGVFEIQQITSSLSSGAYTLSFRGQTSPTLQVIGTAAQLQLALQNISTIGLVSVNGASLTAPGFYVTFLSEIGDLPLLVSSIPGSVVVTETQQGTKTPLECSNRGHCDRTTGKCKCLQTFQMSDNDGNQGMYANCGNQNLYYENVNA